MSHTLFLVVYSVVFFVSRDIARGKENIAIPVYNKEDKETYPQDFVYVQENIETTPMNINRTITSLQVRVAVLEQCFLGNFDYTIFLFYGFVGFIHGRSV